MAGAIDENIIERFVLMPICNKLPKNTEIKGQILRISDKKVYIEIFKESNKHVRRSWQSESYDIFFKLNRTPYQLQHFALEFVKNEQLFTRLINNSFYDCKSSKLKISDSVQMKKNLALNCKDTMLVSLNVEQRSAVEQMVSNVDLLPYVLFGPPGKIKIELHSSFSLPLRLSICFQEPEKHGHLSLQLNKLCAQLKPIFWFVQCQMQPVTKSPRDCSKC